MCIANAVFCFGGGGVTISFLGFSRDTKRRTAILEGFSKKTTRPNAHSWHFLRTGASRHLFRGSVSLPSWLVETSPFGKFEIKFPRGGLMFVG